MQIHSDLLKKGVQIMRSSSFVLSAVALLGSCAQQPSSYALAHADALPSLVGQQVTLSGLAESRKMGAAVRGDGFEIWIAGLQAWPQGYSGRRIQVEGVLEERYDLPVFLADAPDERALVQGMPVPSGTDLHQASRRYVVRHAVWNVIPPTAALP